MTRRHQPINRAIEPHRRSFVPYKHLTDEEHDFIQAAIARGLTDIEVTRQVFRRFGRDLTGPTVKRLRPSESP